MVKLTFFLLASAALLVSAQSTSSSLTIQSAPQTGSSTSVTLRCNPVGGNHPSPKAACQQLKATRGKLNTMTASGAACPSEYNPIAVTIKGKYNGKPVDYKHTFSNPCVAQTKLGALVQVNDNTR